MDDQNAHHVMWIFGPAGTGKSALAQTIAEMCLKDGRLAASFFFSGLSVERNNEKQLICTIAYQIAMSIPSVRPHMENALEHDPILLTKSIARQLQFLIIDPLAHVLPSLSNDNAFPRLILLEGLD
jgi:ABC-type cobalamin transport system ATPase subunit